MKTPTIAITTALFLLPWITLAAPMTNAKARVEAIATGNVARIMAAYDSHTLLEWVGGPLDGSYRSHKAIEEVWVKFSKANSPLTYRIGEYAESANPQGATYSMNIAFAGKKTIKVRYIITYRKGEIVDEIWQVDPKLSVK